MRYTTLLCFVFLPFSAQAAWDLCKQNRDCVAVFDGWCRAPQSINQKYLEEWIEEDKQKAEHAKEAQETCKVMTDTNLFYAYCEQGKCVYGVVDKPAE